MQQVAEQMRDVLEARMRHASLNLKNKHVPPSDVFKVYNRIMKMMAHRACLKRKFGS